jgi:hypothetical protein
MNRVRKDRQAVGPKSADDFKNGEAQIEKKGCLDILSLMFMVL